MTRDKDFKKVVRQKATETKQSYVATRTRLKRETNSTQSEGFSQSTATRDPRALTSTAARLVLGAPSAADVAAYHERGAVLQVRGVFPQAAALGIQDLLWEDVERRIGARREDSATWVTPLTGRSGWGPRRADEVPPRVEALRIQYLDELSKVFEPLLGAGNWDHARAWGSGVMITPPHSPTARWTLTDPEWHYDGVPLRGCWYFLLFCDVPPRSGGTLVVEGSGRTLSDWVEALPADDDRSRLLPRFLMSDPFLRKLSGEEPVESDPDDLLRSAQAPGMRIVELSGRAGDLFVMDSNTLHAAPVRTNVTPRFQVRAALKYGTPRKWRGVSAIRKEKQMAKNPEIWSVDTDGYSR